MLTNEARISDEDAAEVYAMAHPDCEGCGCGLCEWGCGCGGPAPVVIDDLTFCPPCAAKEQP